MPRNPEYSKTLAKQLEHIGCDPPELEYRFCPKRRWRADLAYPVQRILIEIEGGQWIGGRHNRPIGYLRDCEKYNAAARLYWRVFRYTPQQVKSWAAAQEIASILLQREVVIG